MENEDQRQYELTLILSPELEEKELDSIEQEVEKNIKSFDGNLKKKGRPEKRNLAYPIKKFQSGYFLAVDFLFNPEKLKELLSIFKHKKEVLRFVITLIPEEPSPLARTLVSKKKIAESEKKPKIEKIKKLAKEVTEEEIEALKKTEKEIQPKDGRPKTKKTKLEEIDKKLDEILGI